MKPREVPLFLLASLALCFFVFGKGMWGRAILAPVDIAPALWAHYGFVDPASDGIPRNHHIVDQLSYDLPLQWTIFSAYRGGEIPWWDPYTYAGRPLLADAHVNGTDPLRVLCYLALPDFVLAYNWTRILQSLVTGLGFFFLLRRLGFEPAIAGPLALTGQFAGCTSIYFGHPWISAAFAYYPWLWAVWHGAFFEPRPWKHVAAPLLVAAVFFSGNLQSHIYLPLFALAFTAGYGWAAPVAWWKALRIVAPAGILGALLAAPVLLPQIELFLRNERLVATGVQIFRPIDGALALTAFYPWTLGTFRTVGYGNLGFNAFIGTAGFVLAVFGLRAPLPPDGTLAPVRRSAAVLAGMFFVILSIPLLARLIYARSAGLAVLGLVVLAAFGIQRLAESRTAWRRWAVTLGGLAVLIAVVSHLAAWVVYPRLRGRLETRMAAHGTDDGYGGRSARLRAFQVANLPHEITFANPEVLAAWLGLVALAGACAWPALRRHRPALLGLNLVPLLLFAARFTPQEPVVLWERLLAGSAEQRRVAEVLRPDGGRLEEKAAVEFFRLFPMNSGHWHALHGVHGYAALQPRSLMLFPVADETQLADWFYETDGFETPGRLRKTSPSGSARFSWLDGADRPIRITRETLNTLELSFPAGPPARLLRTDTFFPGWSATTPDGTPLPIAPHDRMFSEIAVPAGATGLHLRYRPTGWRTGTGFAAGAIGALLIAFAVSTGRPNLSAGKVSI